MQGKLVVVEGLDGSGKSTAVSFIQNFLEQKRLKVVCTREPGGTKVAEDIRSIILRGNDVVQRTASQLHFARRLRFAPSPS